MLNNKPRLQAVESLVPEGARLLDIGADHGLLPLALIARGEIAGALLTDVNKGPLAACQRNAAVCCPDKMNLISFALSNGFEKVEKDSYDFVTICGMGGELIARIISEGGEKAHVPMVLQPMSHHEKLREFLWKNGYRIVKELYPKEEDRVYLVMQVVYKGKPGRFLKVESYLGKKAYKTTAYYAYCSTVARAAQKRYNGAVLSDNKKEINLCKRIIEEANKRSAPLVADSKVDC